MSDQKDFHATAPSSQENRPYQPTLTPQNKALTDRYFMMRMQPSPGATCQDCRRLGPLELQFSPLATIQPLLI
jgi:hypothetical protein